MEYREDRLWNVIEPIGHIAASALFPGHVECMTHAAGTGIFVVDGPDGLSVYGLWVSTRAMSAEELLGELRSARPRRSRFRAQLSREKSRGVQPMPGPPHGDPISPGPSTSRSVGQASTS